MRSPTQGDTFPGCVVTYFRVPDVKPKKSVVYMAGIMAPMAPVYIVMASRAAKLLMAAVA